MISTIVKPRDFVFEIFMFVSLSAIPASPAKEHQNKVRQKSKGQDER
jgi:hypothetical protein